MSRKDLLIALALFISAMLLSVVHNFASEHFPVTFLFDSTHYLQVMLPVVSFEQALLHGHFQPELLCDKTFLDGIRLDGPILVNVFAPFFLFAKHAPTHHFAKYFILIECLFHGLAVALIFLLSNKIAQNRGVALLAAALWMFYPPALLESERFLTEPLAVPLVLAFACLIVEEKPDVMRLLVLGALTVVIFMLKGALAVALLMALLVRLAIYYSDRKKFLLCVFTGFILALSPWALFTKATMGTMLLGADREPGLNLGLGFDRETGGVPVIIRGPFCEQVFDLENPLASAAGLYKADQIGYLRFFAEKAFKLFIFPWNDFKESVFGLHSGFQFIYHLMLLGAAISGIVCCLVFRRKLLGSQWSAGLILLTLVAGHLVYAIVQPNPRYMMTCVPLLAIFAAIALLKTKVLSQFQYVLGAAISVSLLFVPFGLYYAQSFEYAARVFPLSAHESITRQIILDGEHVPKDLDTVMLLVDGSGITSDTKVVVNGEHLNDSLLPIYEFDTRFYSRIAKDCLMTCARYSFKPNYGSYQVWRAAVIPRSLLKEGENQFTLSQIDGRCMILGDPIGERSLPSLLLFSLERMFMNPLSADGRPKDPVQCAKSFGHEKFVFRNRDNIPRTLDASLRIKLLFTTLQDLKDPEEKKLRSVTLRPRGELDAHPEVAGEVLLDQSDLAGDDERKRKFLLPTNPPSGRYYVSVRGQVKRLGGGNKVAINCLVTDAIGYWRHAEMPAHISIADDWQDFVADGLLRTWDMKELKTVDAQLYPRDWNALQFYGLKKGCVKAQLRNFKVTISPCYTPDCDFDKHIIL
jgi:hypothetical protein